jgi:RNAse (barnase) inhibitor barstar
MKKTSLTDFAASESGGVYRCHSRIADAALAAASRESLRVVVVALQGARDKNAFLNKLAGPLEFPDYFGHNWDAFYDCLAEMAAREAGGVLLVLREASGFARAEPEEFATAIDAMRDAEACWAEQGRRLKVIVELEAAVLSPELPELSLPAG